MDAEGLRRQAAELADAIDTWSHEEHGPLPQETRLALRRVQHVVARCLEKDRLAADEGHPKEEERHGALDSIRHRIEEFEEDHPELIALVDRVARSLSNAGF